MSDEGVSLRRDGYYLLVKMHLRLLKRLVCFSERVLRERETLRLVIESALKKVRRGKGL